jgi:hypothetical protein
MGKYWLKILSIAVNLPQPTLTKTWRKFAKSSPKIDKVAFWRLLAGSAFHMGHACKE